MDQAELLPKVGREKSVIAGSMRIEIQDIKSEIFYPVHFKQEQSSKQGGLPRDADVQTVWSPA